MRLLVQAFILGFSVAAPVGPIGILCIQRTLAGGAARGFATGLGAATADTLYAAAASLGLGAAASVLADHATLIRILSALFIALLGLSALRAPVAEGGMDLEPAGSLAGAFASTLGLTLVNPLTMLSFAAMFAALRFEHGDGDPVRSMVLPIGVFLGSASWWLVLSGLTGLTRGRLAPRHLRWVNRIAGGVLMAFAAGLLWASLGLLCQ